MSAEIRIGYLTALYHTGFILRASGRTDELGIKAPWRLFPDGPAMMEAFQRDEIDLGYIGLPLGPRGPSLSHRDRLPGPDRSPQGIGRQPGLRPSD